MMKVRNVSLTRREILKAASLGAIAVATGSALPRRAGAASEAELFPVASTAYGKVRGVDHAGVKTFKGIRYGASTAGRNRFMPPRPPKSWKGIYDAFDYGQISPQTPADRRNDYPNMILWDRQPGGIGEDCLSLNVWTPALKDGNKRAVLVVFHGGGFATGSGNQLGFDGEGAARLDDVVVVSVTHRLASFGYLNLAGVGAPPEFASAGVAGVMDMVAALEWVQTNIENFGGDAARVMIFGQSGGGAKTSTLLATPSAKGLFSRAGVQSGSALRLATPETATRAAEQFLKQLGITKQRIGTLQTLPLTQLLAAQTSMPPGVGFSPVIGNEVLPHHPFDPSAPPESKDVPMIVGTTLDDAALGMTNYTLDEESLKKQLQQQLGTNAERVYRLYRDTYPNISPYLVQARIATDRRFRRSAFKQAELKAAAGNANVYLYLWEWVAPGFDGKFGAVHGVDVGPALHDFRGPINGSGSAAGQRITDQFAAAWTAFAKNGRPDAPINPAWQAYKTDTRATMVFDSNTRVVNDYRREFRLLWDELTPEGSLSG
jgi:para-nitrobenzyl esterase